MPVPVSQAEVVSAPSGTGTTIAITLPSHQEDDVLIVQAGWKGNQAPQTLTGWNLHFSNATGTAANGCGQGIWWRRVNPSETVSNPTLTIGTTAVERRAIAYCIRGADIDNPANTFWQKQQSVGNSATPTPAGVTTLAPNYLLLHLVTCRGNSAITPPTGYNEEQDSAEGTTICVEGSTKTQATAATVSGQAASISSNRWVAAIIAIPSPDYSYFRSQTSQTATSTQVTGTPPTGLTSADFYGRKDLVLATVEAAGTAPSPNTPADWAEIATWSTTTSGGATTVRQYAALYDGSIDFVFVRTGSGEISLNLSVYRNAHQTVPIGNVNVRQNASSTTSTWDALTRSSTKSTVAAICVADGVPSYTAPAGWIEREDGLGMTCADQIFEADGSTASASFTLSTASPTVVGLVEILSHAGVSTTVVIPGTVTITTTRLIPVLGLAFTPVTRATTLTAFAPTVTTATTTTITPTTAAVSLSEFAPSLILTLVPTTAVLTTTASLPSIFTGILYDSATDTNGTDLADHVGEVGATWTRHADFTDVLTIQSNRIGKDSNTGTTVYYASVNPSTKDYTIEAVMVDIGDVNRALGIGGWIDTGADNGIYFRRQTATAWQFLKIIGVSVTPLETVGTTFNLNASTTIKIVRTGDIFNLYIDGVLTSLSPHTISDSAFQSPGKIGIRASNNHNGTGYHIDRISASISEAAGTAVVPAIATLSISTLAPTLVTQVTPTTANVTTTVFAPAFRESVTPLTATVITTGLAPDLRTSSIPGTQTLTLSVFAPVVQLTEIVTPVTASLAATTLSPALRLSLTPTTSALSLITFTPTVAVSQNITVVPDVSVRSLTTFPAFLRTTAIPATQSLATAVFAPNLARRTIPSTASLSVTTFAPVVAIGRLLTPTTALLTSAGFAPQLSERITPIVEVLSLTGLAPSIVTDDSITVAPPTALLSLSVTGPSLQLTTIPSSSVLNTQSFASTIHLTITPATGTLTTAQFAPTLQTGIQLSLSTLTITRHAPSISTGAGATTTVVPVTYSLVATRHAPIIFQSSPTPSHRTFMVESPRRTYTVPRSNRVYVVPDPDRTEIA